MTLLFNHFFVSEMSADDKISMKQVIRDSIREPDLIIHKILSKQCLDPDAVAGNAIRMCQGLIESCLREEGIYKDEYGAEIHDMLCHEWERYHVPAEDADLLLI
jgi:hypothetical protein